MMKFKAKTAINICLYIILILCLIIFNLNEIHKAVTADKMMVTNAVKIPILMYHSVCYNKTKSDYIITPQMLEADFKFITENGYNSVFVSDIINFVKNNVSLPENPVCVTFDDGHINNLTYVLPLAKKYNIKFSVSVVGEYSQKAAEGEDRNSDYAYLNWDDISVLKKSGYAEICSHTFGLHSIKSRKGCMKLKSETVDEYKEVLTDDLKKLQDNLNQKSEITPVVFTYPYGLVSPESKEVLKNMSFEAALICSEKVNYLSYKDNELLFSLGRFNRSPKNTAEKILKSV